MKLQLQPGPTWQSFEQLRNGHTEQLRQILPGQVATLNVKATTLRLMHALDFDKLMATARHVAEMEAALELMKTAVRIHTATPSEGSRTLLLQAVQHLTALKARFDFQMDLP